MNPAVLMRERIERKLAGRSAKNISSRASNNPAVTGSPTVLIATIDPQIHDGLANLLGSFPANTLWVGSVEDVKTLTAREHVAVCLCGFWLRDGTYREVIRHLRRERLEIPTILLSAPDCPHEYGEYIADMNIGALNFLCYPYERPVFEKMLGAAITSRPAESKASENDVYLQTRGEA